MNKLDQANSDGSDAQIEMYEGNWALICQYAQNAAALFGLFCASVIVGYTLLRWLA